MFKLVCIIYKHFVGWLANPSRDCTSITFVKLKECDGEFEVLMSLTYVLGYVHYWGKSVISLQVICYIATKNHFFGLHADSN